MAKKGSKKFNLSAGQHKRLFRIANYSKKPGSYASFFYHGEVLADMDKKGRTLTAAEKKTIWKYSKSRGADYEGTTLKKGR